MFDGVASVCLIIESAWFVSNDSHMLLGVELSGIVCQVRCHTSGPLMSVLPHVLMVLPHGPSSWSFLMVLPHVLNDLKVYGNVACSFGNSSCPLADEVHIRMHMYVQ